LFLPLRRRIPDEMVATQVERAFPTLGERLLTTIELAHAGPVPGMSTQIISALARETDSLAAPMDFRTAMPRRIMRRPLGFASVSVLVLAAHIMIAPAAMRVWLSRLLYPHADIPIYAHTHVFVWPEDTVVPRGTNLVLGVKVY